MNNSSSLQCYCHQEIYTASCNSIMIINPWQKCFSQLTASQRRLVEGAIGEWAHCNCRNGINGTVSNIWKPHVWRHSIPAITISLSSYCSSHQPPLLPVSDHTLEFSRNLCTTVALDSWCPLRSSSEFQTRHDCPEVRRLCYMALLSSIGSEEVVLHVPLKHKS